jgi:transcriptional regulator with XRE-family HTH domain
MGTTQSAIARIERGKANMRLSTLVNLAESLHCTVRIDLDPVELVGHEERMPRWWERDCVHAMAAVSDNDSGMITVRLTQTVPVALGVNSSSLDSFFASQPGGSMRVDAVVHAREPERDSTPRLQTAVGSTVF